MTNESQLTRRQIELVSLLLKGKPNRQIGAEMGITEGSVKMELCRIFKTLQVKSRCELMAGWYQAGLQLPEIPISLPRVLHISPPRRFKPRVSDEELDRRAIALGVR